MKESVLNYLNEMARLEADMIRGNLYNSFTRMFRHGETEAFRVIREHLFRECTETRSPEYTRACQDMQNIFDKLEEQTFPE